MSASALPRTCVIGAGSSGIAGLKGLLERDVPAVGVRGLGPVGGNWVFGNRNGTSSAYRDLHINTSRERMEYSDFPMPKSIPDFPHHTQIAAYFDAYADHFGLRSHIRFETRVTRASRRSDGVWEVTSEGPDGAVDEQLYDALLVANGHHWDPRWPEPPFPGHFDGEELHAHHYRDADGWRGKRVVVLGMGNSAMDIAVEASYVADRVFLAARRGAWVLPKYIAGIPLDQAASRGSRLDRLASDPRVPWRLQQRGLEAIFLKHIGSMESYGLPAPDHRLGEAHPTISGRILDRITHGRITPKANIASLEGDRVRFADGSVEEADVVVYCTGYKISFPFFSEELISAPDNDLPLFRRVFHPEIDNVFFLALLQPLGATMPLAEAQGRWIAAYLRGEYHLPSPAELRDDIARERERMFKRYVASKRHTMQVDFDRYLYELSREMRRGAERARAAGYRLPVAARAEEAGGRGYRVVARRMPTFCRHNRFIQNCPICTPREPAGSSRLSPDALHDGPRAARVRVPAPACAWSGRRARPRTATASELVPGLKSSADAARLADELAFSAARLAELATDPPGLYAEVADAARADPPTPARTTRPPAPPAPCPPTRAALAGRPRAPRRPTLAAPRRATLSARRRPGSHSSSPTSRRSSPRRRRARSVRGDPPRCGCRGRPASCPISARSRPASAPPTTPPAARRRSRPTVPGRSGRAPRRRRSPASRRGRPSVASGASSSASRCPACTARHASIFSSRWAASASTTSARTRCTSAPATRPRSPPSASSRSATARVLEHRAADLAEAAGVPARGARPRARQLRARRRAHPPRLNASPDEPTRERIRAALGVPAPAVA